jgi:thiamine biosynthesis lipoprotein
VEEFICDGSAPEVAYASHRAMHTLLEVVLTGENRQVARGSMQEVFSLVDELEFALSRFAPGGGLYELNLRADGGLHHTGDLLRQVLLLSQEHRERTGGYFDLCAVSGGEYALEEGGVRIRPGSALDAGGFAKGFALDMAAKMLRDRGVMGALLNFGSSSCLAIGTHPHGDNWPVGTDALAERSVEFRLKDSALSLSGLTREGKTHIFDPVGGEYARGNFIVAVTGPGAATAEALSTALYAAPEEKRADIMAMYPEYEYTVILNE